MGVPAGIPEGSEWRFFTNTNQNNFFFFSFFDPFLTAFSLATGNLQLYK